MSAYNSCQFIGYLTADPKIEYTVKSQKIASFNVGVNTYGPEGKGTADFIPVEAWEKLATLAETRFHKGTPLFIEGRLKVDAWKDKEGKMHTRFRVVARTIQLLGAAKASSEPENAPQSPSGGTYARKEASTPSAPSYGVEAQDDIPF